MTRAKALSNQEWTAIMRAGFSATSRKMGRVHDLHKEMETGYETWCKQLNITGELLEQVATLFHSRLARAQYWNESLPFNRRSVPAHNIGTRVCLSIARAQYWNEHQRGRLRGRRRPR